MQINITGNNNESQIILDSSSSSISRVSKEEEVPFIIDLSAVNTFDDIVKYLKQPGQMFEEDPNNPSTMYFSVPIFPFSENPRQSRELRIWNIPDNLENITFDKIGFVIQFNPDTGKPIIYTNVPVGNLETPQLSTKNKEDIPGIYKASFKLRYNNDIDEILDSGKGFVQQFVNSDTNPPNRIYFFVFDLRDPINIKRYITTYSPYGNGFPTAITVENFPPNGWLKNTDFTDELQTAYDNYVLDSTNTEAITLLTSPGRAPVIWSGPGAGIYHPTLVYSLHSTNPQAMQAWQQYYSEYGDNGKPYEAYQGLYKSLADLRKAFETVPEYIYNISEK